MDTFQITQNLCMYFILSISIEKLTVEVVHKPKFHESPVSGN